MANNRKTTNGRRNQVVYSEPQKLFVEKYLSPKGKRLLMNKEITKTEAWLKYGKNRYRINPNARPVKVIKHNI